MKRAVAAILLPILLLTMLTATAWAVDHGYGYWQLTDNQKYLYDVMAERLAYCDSHIELDESRGVTVEDAQLVMTIFAADYPEYSWFGVKEGERMYYLNVQCRGDIVVILQPRYNSYHALDHQTALQSAAQTAINSIPATAQSQYDKALYLHDYMAQQVSYSYGTTDNMTAYGALINGSAGCVGYSRAYQYLLQQAGITAWTVTGTATNRNGTQNHAWNVANLDGGWYYIDVTWDDASSGILHKYFGLSLTEISADHTLESPYSYMKPSGGTVAHPPVEEQPDAEPAVETEPTPAPETVPEETAPVQEPEQPEKVAEEEKAAAQTEPQNAVSTAPDLAAETEETEAVELAEETEETDPSNTVLWIAIAATAAGGIAGLVIWGRRRRVKREKDGSSCRTD